MSGKDKEDGEYPKVPKEAIVQPGEERQIKTFLKPEEEKSRDEIDYDRIKTVDHDADSDDNPDWDPEV